MQLILTDSFTSLLLVAIPAALLIVLLFLLLFIKPVGRFAVKKIANDITSKLLTEAYTKNLAEFLPSLKRFSVLNAIELSLRAQTGKVLARPLGTPKHFLGFENLMFSPRQMTGLPLKADAPVDMKVTIGATAHKPLQLEIPLIISSMAYGLALSQEAKIALAKAAKQLGTATGSGEGPVLPEEIASAGKYILQISRWTWGLRTDEQLGAADMLEVQMGQGADMGAAPFEAKQIKGRALKLSNAKANLKGEIPSYPAPEGVNQPEDWPAFIKHLRQRAKGIPIALKLMATDHIEADLAVALELGFDAVIIDGAQGGSHASPAIKQDDFGIPSLYALIRAKRFLGNKQISLIVAGGYFTSGQCLKALTLGADAIYMGTVPLFALAHNQIHKVSPFEPLTTLIYYDSAAKTELNVEQAVQGVVNTIASMTLEMEEAMRALGKSSLKELTPDDLVALDAATASVTGVKLAYDCAWTAGQEQKTSRRQIVRIVMPQHKTVQPRKLLSKRD